MSKTTSSYKSSRIGNFASTFSTSLKSFKSLFSTFSRGSENSLPSYQRHLPSNASLEATPIPQDPNAPLPEPQFLPICYRSDRYATRLMQPNLIDRHVNSDGALFDLLRSSYQATRKRKLDVPVPNTYFKTHLAQPVPLAHGAIP
jgi:hypothetical protein